MLERLLDNALSRAKAQRVSARPVDPQAFGDALATKTEWTPLTRGRTWHWHRRLRTTGPGRLEFSPPRAFKPAGGVMIAIGAYYGLPSLFGMIGFNTVVAGALLVGGWKVLRAPPGMVFDPAIGAHHASRDAGRKGTPGPTGGVPLSDIYALQLLAERVIVDNRSEISFELNLVLRDASRVNVIEKDNLGELQAEAQELARHLNCKLWDATTVGEQPGRSQPATT